MGMGYVQVLGYLMPDLPKSVFSVGFFARDFGFEKWFKYHLCIIWIPRVLDVEQGLRDFEIIPLSNDYLYDIPESWFN